VRLWGSRILKNCATVWQGVAVWGKYLSICRGFLAFIR